MAAPTNAANVKKALANPEPSTHGLMGASIVEKPLLTEELYDLIALELRSRRGPRH